MSFSGVLEFERRLRELQASQRYRDAPFREKIAMEYALLHAQPWMNAKPPRRPGFWGNVFMAGAWGFILLGAAVLVLTMLVAIGVVVWHDMELRIK